MKPLLHSSSAMEVGKTPEINSLKFQKCFEKINQEIMVPAQCRPHPPLASLYLHSSLRSSFCFSPQPCIHWRFQNHREAATSFYFYPAGFVGLPWVCQWTKKEEEKTLLMTVNMPPTCSNERNISGTLESLCGLI